MYMHMYIPVCMANLKYLTVVMFIKVTYFDTGLRHSLKYMEIETLDDHKCDLNFCYFLQEENNFLEDNEAKLL